MSEAETVLGELGIPMSNAIGMFLKQVALQRGIPFEVKLPSPAPLALASLTKTELDSAIQEGLDDIAAGRTAPPSKSKNACAPNLNCTDRRVDIARIIYQGRDISQQLTEPFD